MHITWKSIYQLKNLEHAVADGAAANGKVPATNAEAMNNINDKKQEQKWELMFSSMASKPIIIRWIKTSSRPL